MAIDDVYLGDGVYASFDGYHIWLDLCGQDNTTRIALEPVVLKALNRYAERIERLRESMVSPETTEAEHDEAAAN